MLFYFPYILLFSTFIMLAASTSTQAGALVRTTGALAGFEDLTRMPPGHLVNGKSPGIDPPLPDNVFRPVVAAPVENNDNATGKGENIFAAFDSFWDKTAPIDFLFTVRNSDVFHLTDAQGFLLDPATLMRRPGSLGEHDLGIATPKTGEYWMPMDLHNNTTDNWNQITIKLGFGTFFRDKDTDAVTDFFIQNPVIDDLDFDFNANPKTGKQQLDPNGTFTFTAGDFSYVAGLASADNLVWQAMLGKNLHPGQAVRFSWSIDMPNSDLIHGFADTKVPGPSVLIRDPTTGEVLGYQFTMRIEPKVVPEPATVWLITLGMIGLLGILRARSQQGAVAKNKKHGALLCFSG